MSVPSPYLVSFVVAVADNGVIGRGEALPWRLKSDLRRFRKLTMGHPLIMGRKTFQSIGRPLDGRASIVLSRSPKADADDGVFHAASWPDALDQAKAWAALHAVTEIFVIGGSTLFERALADCSRIYLTRVHGAPDGDIHWQAPAVGGDWVELSRLPREAGPQDEFSVTDSVLERRQPLSTAGL